MNMKFAKKLLAVTLAASMMVVPMTAFASTGGGEDEPTTPAATVTESAGETTTATVVEVKNYETMSSVAGVKSTVGGAFAVKSANGLAVKTPAANIPVAPGAKAFVKAYDVTAKNTPAAVAAADAFIAAQGGRRLAIFNFELGQMLNKKFTLLGQDVLFDLTVGVKGATPGKTLAGGQILPGGVINAVADADTNASTFTGVGLKGGLSCLFVYEK